MIARLEWINPLEEEAAKKTISSSRRKGGSRAKVKKTELPKWLTEAKATAPGMKGMPGEMPSASYAPWEPPLTGGSRQRIGGKWTDRFNLQEEIRQSNIVPQEDRLTAEQSKIALELDRKRNLTPRERADEDLADIQPDSELKPGSEKKQEIKPVEGSTRRYKQKSIQLQGKEITQQALTKKSKADFEKEAMDKWINKTRNSPAQRSGAFEKEELWDLHKKANPKWDAAYTPKSEIKQTPQKKIEKELKTDEITEQVKETKAKSMDTSATNLTKMDIAKKLGGNLLKDTDVGKIYNTIETGKQLLAAKKATTAATAGTNAAMMINPVTAIIALGLTMANNATKKEGSPNLRYQGIQPEEYWV